MIDHLPPFELLTALRQLGQKVPSCSRILQSWIMRPLANWTLTMALSMPRFTARRLKTLISSIEILLSDDLTRFDTLIMVSTPPNIDHLWHQDKALMIQSAE
jgi:hypothetical protein